jgi:multiple sugar transport system substrate-binding protein
VLTPLGSALRKAGVDLGDAVPTAITYASYMGTLYALPFDIHTLLWYVNVDLFKKAGLVDKQGNPVISQNAAQFLAEARVMKHKTGKQFVQAQTIDADLGTDWMFDALAWQQGGDVLTKIDTQAAVNSPQALRAVTFWSSLIKAGYTTATVKYTNSLFLNGNVATLINGTWAVNQFGTQVKDHQAAFTHLAVVPLPTIFGHPASWSESHTWMIPRQSSADPAKTAAELQVLKYLYDNDLQWTRTGHLSVRKSVLASTTYRTLPYRGEYARAALIAHPMPRIMSIGEYETTMHNDILAVYLGQKSAPAALADAEQRVNQALKTSH